MANRLTLQRRLKSATIHDLGEYTLARLIELSGCSNETALLGLLGDEKTLDRFLARRQPAKLALPEQPYPSYDLAGDFVDVGRYLSGEPECMFNYDGQIDQAKFIDVTIRLGRSSSTFDHRVFAYYANVLQAIDLLESQGLRCRITAMLDCFHQDKLIRIILKTPIKEHSEPINMAVFAGVILNNKFFTQVFCNMIENHYRQDILDRCYCSDISDIEVPQTDQTITFPSMYFNNYQGQTSYDFESYMRVIGLGHLLPNQ